MKILFVTNQIPYPPDNGVRIVSHNAMRLMYEAGHDLALAVLTVETGDVEMRFQHMSTFCQNGMAWWMSQPYRGSLSFKSIENLSKCLFYVERYRSSKFREKLSKLIDSFRPDVIHFDLITMIQYRDIVPPGIGTIASINDSQTLSLENELMGEYHSGLGKIYRQVQFKQTRLYEKTEYTKFNAVHVMSDVDAKYLRYLDPEINAVVIPNGVESSLFGISQVTQDQINIIFVATLIGDNVYYLQQFLEYSWPIIHKNYPDVEFHIVGKVGNETQSLKASNHGKNNVVFLGYVECLVDAYKHCGIAIVPIKKNCGIINKAIEAMAAGLAVVGFEKTFSGIIQGEDGVHYIATPNFIGMGQSVVELIRDEARRQKIQNSAHELASEYYSWNNRVDLYERMYRNAAVR